MSGPNMSIGECTLLLRGWAKEKREVRAVLKGSIAFAVFGTIWAANKSGFSIQVGKNDFVAASLNGCACAFLDASNEESVLGRRVESGIVAVRPDFDLAVMILAE